MTTSIQLREIVGALPDPELPVLTLADLGILRDVNVDGEQVTVTITPTYSGCPALAEMRADIRQLLASHGFPRSTVRTVLSPAWSTDDITEDGRRRLREHGIAPPGRSAAGPVSVPLGRSGAVPDVACPACGSSDTEQISRFGSTPCKALRRCRSCREPFDHVKPH